jgi:cell division protein FtsL
MLNSKVSMRSGTAATGGPVVLYVMMIITIIIVVIIIIITIMKLWKEWLQGQIEGHVRWDPCIF